MRSHLLRPLVAALTVSVLAACGSSDDDDAPMQTAVGTITAFGSVVVNGVRFDDSVAAITMDGAPATRDRLRVGMVVQVRGWIHADGTGVAGSIQYDDCVQGPITAMNRVQNTVTVLGQTVRVDDGTVFDGVTLRDMNGFAIGDQVEISCLRDPALQQIRATRMERQGVFQNGTSALSVKGTVASLDLAAGTFMIDGLKVGFAGIAAGNRPAGLANGMTVEASGRQFANGTLTADRLRDRDRDRISYPDGDGLEVEGYVSDFVSLSSFKVAGQVVDAANAVIRNGTAADIADGVKVEAEGVMREGVLVAGVLVLKLQSNVRIEAGMQAKDGVANTITLLGRTIKVNADTEWRDRLGGSNQPQLITLAALNPADRLEVMAFKDAGGSLTAARVERTDADALVVVKATADGKTPATLVTLAGIGVATGEGTRYRDASGTLVDATTFYDAVQVPPAVPTVVHARGVVATLATNIVDATRGASTIGELEIGGD
ncbi:DUF5666 domain-containing protein [Rubrivivax sp. RP6-9]|uniref:DUF5666 domain-containing protein n=1 Tax=Rubrivivax sp. RP6-9 TaxID=3415750 RepID=UPI003CC5B65C